MVLAFTDALEVLTETGNVLDQGTVEDQLLFLLLRQHLVEQALSQAVSRQLLTDSSAASALAQYLYSLNKHDVVSKIQEQAKNLAARILQTPAGEPPKMRITDVAFETLKEAGQFLHFRELATLLLNKGVVPGGKDPADTLRAYIHRDPRFERVPHQRGCYRIVEATK